MEWSSQGHVNCRFRSEIEECYGKLGVFNRKISLKILAMHPRPGLG